jgi:lipopolysaccharide biosynthesis glycosyltransferase
VNQSFNKTEPYFNAGVAVINFDKWRRENITGMK